MLLGWWAGAGNFWLPREIEWSTRPEMQRPTRPEVVDSEGDPLRCTGRRVLAPAWATWRCVAQSSFWFLWLPCCLCGVQRKLEDAELPHWPSHVEEQGWSVLEVPDLEGGSEAVQALAELTSGKGCLAIKHINVFLEVASAES